MKKEVSRIIQDLFYVSFLELKEAFRTELVIRYRWDGTESKESNEEKCKMEKGKY